MDNLLKKKTILIIGAGLVGTILSVFLAQRGYEVRIYEKRGDPRSSDSEKQNKRSINIVINGRGTHALNAVGILDEIKEIAVPIKERKIHNMDGSLVSQSYGNDNKLFSVSRGKLNNVLMNTAETHGVKFFFNHRLIEINWKNNIVTFDINGDKIDIIFDLLFGADGANSQAREEHMKNQDNFIFLKKYLDYEYKELKIPPTSNGDYALDAVGHFWPRKSFLIFAFPNLDKSFNAVVVLPIKGNYSFHNLNKQNKVKKFFESYFGDLIKIMPNYIEEFFKNPVSSIVKVKCYPWIRNDKFALIGDAAHAMSPVYGQGMNCGFEDCSILAQLIDKYSHDWKFILKKYQIDRELDSSAAQEITDNFMTEITKKLQNSEYLQIKLLESKILAKKWGEWVPNACLVHFSTNVRYSHALKIAKMQEEILNELVLYHKSIEDFNEEEFENLIIKKLNVLNRNKF